MLSGGNIPCFCHFFRTMRISRLIFMILAVFLMMTAISYYTLTHLDQTRNHGDVSSDNVRRMLGLLDVDDASISGQELKRRIEELLRIKASVQKELRNLEQKRSEMQRQISAFVRKIDELKLDATRQTTELEKLRVSITQARTAQVELAERNTPELRPPIRLRALPSDNFMSVSTKSDDVSCSFGTCFDLTRCPLSSGFPVYFYNNVFGWTSTKDGFGYAISDPDEACLFVAAFHPNDANFKENFAYWKGDGRNHILIDVTIHEESENVSTNIAALENSGRAMIASSRLFDSVSFRPSFDVVLPSFKYLDNPPDLWSKLPNLVPIRRKFLVTYQEPFLAENKRIREIIEEPLSLVNDDKTNDKVVIDFHCRSEVEVGLCGSFQKRGQLLQKSNFALILSSSKTSDLLKRLSEALESGTIPVFICLPDCQNLHKLLPYSQVLDWTRASLFLPVSRITELQFLLRSFPDSDLFSMKRQGRLLWQNYLGSGPAAMSSILNLVRTRAGLPPAPVQEEPSKSIFSEGFKPLHMDSLPMDLEPGESLGPLEPPLPSPVFRRNYTFMINSRSLWNDKFMEAFKMPPHNPFETILPTEAKFLGSSLGFRPVANGEGGSGKEFSQALGGNTPSEQFTIVMLTYEREPVLMDSLSRLYGLPYLNKVIVVWNSEMPPSPDLRWPEIGVPILVLKTDKNSLNNRFLPYDAIETEAVLSVDDDVHLRHDEIIFGFRVWREHRHRLVGFPGRFHAWDRENFSWNYNSNYSCELSMVLTGAAFYHKYYSYAYAQIMPQAIRDKIDEFMNCEDLAMNFLISHMTREPPVKVTSRWTFRCPGCPVTLSEDDSHFQERHACINFFTKVYGYNPLLFTQYRADSVLFKTRIPQDKQKCFKFI